MHLKQRIKAFVELGTILREMARIDLDINHENNAHQEIVDVIKYAKAENSWFTEENIQFALKSWSDALSEENLNLWINNYDLMETSPKQIAIIMAGNIPLVGFHDFLSVLISGNKVLIKLASNDKRLLPFIAQQLIAINPEFEDLIKLTEGKISNFEAVIATGSNNTARYFEHYFEKYPHIIRKNRNSIAVLSNDDTTEDLERLANDIFRYFGLGCRNVSKLYVPKDYDFAKLFQALYKWKDIIYNNKYMNNYDYNKAVYLMDSMNLLDNEFILLKEDTNFSSPIAVLFYENYDSMESLRNELIKENENIQVVVSKIKIEGAVNFGMTQTPQLWDYADGVDTIEFLRKL